MNDEFYCPQPWTGGYFTAEKQSVCCSHSGIKNPSPIDFLKSDHVKEIKQRLMTGNLDNDCSRCRKDEANGLVSLRQTLTSIQKYRNIDFIKDIDADSIPKAIEVKFSNLCNFKCRMCTPPWSNLIDKEFKENPQLGKWYQGSVLLQKDIGHQLASENFVKEITSFLPNLKWLNITGGEPMLAPEFLQLLDIIKTEGYTSSIGLHITTNCSTINPNFINVINDFEKVHFSLSLDGIEDVAEYQRHGTNWKKVSDNVLYYCNLMSKNDKISINSNTVISAYTVLDLARVTSYLVDLHNRFGISLTYNIVFDYLNPLVLVGELRERAKKEVQRSIDIIGNIESLYSSKSQLESLQNMLYDKPENREDFENFVNFTKELDAIRNEDFNQIFGLNSLTH